MRQWDTAGAALSMRVITGQPIKFLGNGEKLAALELFYPDRIASRILGMGDILTLIEKASENIEIEEQENMTKRFTKSCGAPSDRAESSATSSPIKRRMALSIMKRRPSRR